MQCRLETRTAAYSSGHAMRATTRTRKRRRFIIERKRCGARVRVLVVPLVLMRILLSNDDGYFAPGLERLAAALAPHAEITVVAPERDRSGASNSLTLDRPLTVRRAANGFLFVNGTPTDCVHLAVTGLLDY